MLSVSFVLLLCGAALVPSMTREWMSAITGAVALWGLARAIISTIGIRGLGSEVHWTDFWFYGVVPAVLYLALGGIAVGLLQGAQWTAVALAIVSFALLALAVRNEWDLITWIAPRAETGPPEIDS